MTLHSLSGAASSFLLPVQRGEGGEDRRDEPGEGLFFELTSFLKLPLTPTLSPQAGRGSALKPMRICAR